MCFALMVLAFDFDTLARRVKVHLIGGNGCRAVYLCVVLQA